MYSLYVLRTAIRAAWPDAPLSDIEVGLQPVPAALPAVAGFLVTPERRGRVELVERVRPDHAGAQPGRHPQDPRPLVGPDPRGHPVRRVIGLLHRLGGGAEREHGQHRAEDL